MGENGNSSLQIKPDNTPVNTVRCRGKNLGLYLGTLAGRFSSSPANPGKISSSSSLWPQSFTHKNKKKILTPRTKLAFPKFFPQKANGPQLFLQIHHRSQKNKKIKKKRKRKGQQRSPSASPPSPPPLPPSPFRLRYQARKDGWPTISPRRSPHHRLQS